MEPRIQYAKTTDGVSIAYWTMGSGEPPLIMSPPLAWSHISRELVVPELASWYEHLASGRMLVRYDQRNQGLSDQNVERLSEAEQASDIEAVMGRLGVRQVDILGFYGSGAPMVRVAAEHPTAVRKLILWDANLVGERFFASDRMRAVRGLIETDWELFSETFARVALGWSSNEAHEWPRFIRRAVERRDAALLLDAFAKADWRPWLTQIRAPTLVVRTPWSFPGTEGRWADIPDMELIDLRDRQTAYPSEAGRAAIDAFLGEGEQPPLSDQTPNSPSSMAVILFADIVDSTSLTEQLGDAAFREKARELDTSLRSIIREAGGTPVEGKVLGDGVLAVFTSARQAIECALRCDVAGEPMGLQLHLGIHAGDVIREENNVYGGAVNIAARIAGASAPGEVLVSDTVRGLARTSAGVVFEERGEQTLKGIAEPQRLFAVRGGRA